MGQMNPEQMGADQLRLEVAQANREAVVNPHSLSSLPRRIAFELFYLANFDRVFGKALVQAPDFQTAEDVAQDAFALFWKRPDYPLQGPAASSKLHDAEHNLITAIQRKQRNFPEPLNETALYEQARIDGEDQIWLDMEARDLMIALVQLRPEQQDLLGLRFFGDLPDSEIAERMGISEGNVRVRQHRALIDLREIFSAWENNVY